MEKSNKQIAMEAINKFIYYTNNFLSVRHTFHNGEVRYLPDVIKGFEGSCDRDHFASKWLWLVRNHDNETAFTKFYLDLDGGNRKAFMNWILDHYTDEQKLKF